MTAAVPEHAPGTMFGRYRIQHVLGSGGMGVVYRAWDPQLARPVAIKVVQRAADDHAGRARLVREAQSLARVSHANVCQVYDVGTDGDEVWVAMELIEGTTLRDFAERAMRDDLLAVLLQAAHGIAAAHDANIIHRDVKPENVLVELARPASLPPPDVELSTVPGKRNAPTRGGGDSVATDATVDLRGSTAATDATVDVRGRIAGGSGTGADVLARGSGAERGTRDAQPRRADVPIARGSADEPRARARRRTGAPLEPPTDARPVARRAVVTDFGLARVDLPIDPVASTISSDLGASLTMTGTLAGTPAYLAPEQLTGSALDARVDQFAWAVMCWELVTGMRPFPILAAARLDAIRAGITPPPNLARPLATALCRALAMSPRDRFATMHELIAAIGTSRTASPRTRSKVPLAIAAASASSVAATLAVWHFMQSRDTPRTDPSPPMTIASGGSSTQPAATAPPDASAPPAAVASVRGSDSSVRAPDTTVRASDTSVRAADRTVKPPPAKSKAALTVLDDAWSAPRRNGVKPLDHERGVAILDAFCHLPYDAAHPDPALPKPWIDWGKVTRREIVTGTIGTQESTLLLYEVAGQRATYRFDGTTFSASAGVLDAEVGQWVAVCQDDISEIYHLPPAWKGPLGRMTGFIAMSAPPRIGELAKLAPLHISELHLRVTGEQNKLDTSRRYVIDAKPESVDPDGRWFMDKWWLEVPRDIPGANLVAAGKRMWFVVEQPRLEDQPDGSKPRLVMRAVAVVSEMFPR